MKHDTEPLTIGELVLNAGQRQQDMEAVLANGFRLTYGDLVRRATTVASALANMGVSAQNRVGILLENSIEYYTALVGIALLGAVSVPINPRYQPAELRFILEHSEVAVLLTREGSHHDFIGRLANGIPDISFADHDLKSTVVPRLRRVVSVEPVSGEVLHSFANFVDDEMNHLSAHAVNNTHPDKDAVILYTSGTTSSPKGCRLSHGALVRNGRAASQQRFFLTNSDRIWNPLPLCHVGGLVTSLAAIDAGALTITSGHFDPNQSLDIMVHERATVAYPAFPVIIGDLLEAAEQRDQRIDSVRIVTAVGPAPLLGKLNGLFPTAQILNMYGSSETSGIICYSSSDDDWNARMETCGRPYEGVTVKIVDPETEVALPASVEGEICVQSYSLMSGYLDDPDATDRAIRDNWYYTGDLGMLDDVGRLRFCGRLKDMLKVGGENVSAVEVEACLGAHPSVKLAQVVGVPDKRLDEVAVAFVELRPDARVDPSELIEFCRARLAGFKVPREVVFVKEWPMSTTKVQKHQLVSGWKLQHVQSETEGSE